MVVAVRHGGSPSVSASASAALGTYNNHNFTNGFDSGGLASNGDAFGQGGFGNGFDSGFAGGLGLGLGLDTLVVEMARLGVRWLIGWLEWWSRFEEVRGVYV